MIVTSFRTLDQFSKTPAVCEIRTTWHRWLTDTLVLIDPKADVLRLIGMQRASVTSSFAICHPPPPPSKKKMLA